MRSSTTSGGPEVGVARQGSAVDHRGARARRHPQGAPDYLPQLQQELLAVIARYEKIDLSNVTVNLDGTAAARCWS